MNTRSTELKPALTMQLIREAHARIRDKIHRTPVMTSEVLDGMAGNRLFFKCENLQKVGAFKARGATNAVFLLTDAEAAKGVVTHSSGNHAAALARAARLRGIPAYIVMPSNSPQAKQAAVRRYGGDVVLCEPTLAARESTARQVMERTGAIFIHPYDDLRVMAGQGTTAIELLEDVPDLDVILCPVGGGGQLSGIAVAAKDIRPVVRVIGVEPAGADDAARSLKAGHIIPMLEPRTIADGLKTSLGQRPFAEILRLVDDIVTVREESIVQAMRQVWEVLKLIVEPSGAVSYAAVVEGRIPASGANVGIILSGGNLDLNRLPWQIAPAL
jgi:threonine dehydratase